MTEAEDKKIILPEPEGHPRGAIRFKNGGMQIVNASLEELVEVIEKFMTDPSAPALLELPDGQYGRPFYLTRAAIDDIQLLCTAWVKVVAPHPGILRPNGADIASLELHQRN